MVETNEWLNERKWMNKEMYVVVKRMNEWMNKWMQWLNEWMHELKNEMKKIKHVLHNENTWLSV